MKVARSAMFGLKLIIMIVQASAWSEVFELDASKTYFWTSSKVNGKYYAASISIAAKEETNESVDENTLLQDCKDLSPSSDESIQFPTSNCLNLLLDEALHTSTFPLSVSESARFVIVASNDPSYFEADSHFLKDSDGNNIYSVDHEDDHDHDEDDEHDHDEHDEHDHDEHDEHDHDEHDEHDHDEHDNDGSSSSSSSRRPKAWRLSMLASLVVLLCIMVGVIVRLPFATGEQEYKNSVSTKCFAALASGALLALAAFLVLFEAVHLVGERWKVEEQASWRFGAALVGGYAVGYVSELFFKAESCDYVPPTAGQAQIENGDVENEARVVGKVAKDGNDQLSIKRPINWTLVFSIFTGDFFCNFVDGIVVAQGFLECSASKGWTIVAATVYHELAQEVSDFALLVNAAGLKVGAAILVNFVSGLGVFAGVITFMLTKPGSGTQGVLLAFGGGVYIYLAATQAAPQVLNSSGQHSFFDNLLILFSFCVGVVAIGLVLLDHEHCYPDDGGGHAHHHRR